MKNQQVVTLAQLEALRACEEQRERFEELFGASVEVTEALCVEHAQVFEWNWAAERLLTAPARAEYREDCDSAGAEYDKAVASAWAEYDKAVASAWAKYSEDCDSAWAEYDKAIASAFARAFLSQGIHQS